MYLKNICVNAYRDEESGNVVVQFSATTGNRTDVLSLEETRRDSTTAYVTAKAQSPRCPDGSPGFGLTAVNLCNAAFDLELRDSSNILAVEVTLPDGKISPLDVSE